VIEYVPEHLWLVGIVSSVREARICNLERIRMSRNLLLAFRIVLRPSLLEVRCGDMIVRVPEFVRYST
jgi:hypothetical protein